MRFFLDEWYVFRDKKASILLQKLTMFAKNKKICIIVSGSERQNIEMEIIMNREELITEISKSAKVTKKVAADVLSATIDTIQTSVKKGNKVTLVGFGTFEARKRAARVGRNPQTGKELKIAAKTVPAFSAGKKFKELVK